MSVILLSYKSSIKQKLISSNAYFRQNAVILLLTLWLNHSCDDVQDNSTKITSSKVLLIILKSFRWFEAHKPFMVRNSAAEWTEGSEYAEGTV